MGDAAITEKNRKPQELPRCFRRSPNSTFKGAPSTPTLCLVPCVPENWMGVPALS